MDLFPKIAEVFGSDAPTILSALSTLGIADVDVHDLAEQIVAVEQLLPPGASVPLRHLLPREDSVGRQAAREARRTRRA